MLDLYLGKGQHMDLITKFPFSGCDPRSLSVYPGLLGGKCHPGVALPCPACRV